MMYRGNTQLRVRFLLMLSINQKKYNNKQNKINKNKPQKEKIKQTQQSTINK